MNYKPLCLLGLLASGDACWPTQTNPTIFQVTPGTLDWCPQPATITILGPQLLGDKPTVSLIPLIGTEPNLLKAITVPSADVKMTTDEAAQKTTLLVSLPRGLVQASYQVNLTVPGHSESNVAGSFIYSTAIPGGTSPRLSTQLGLSEVAVTLSPMPTAPAQAAVWHPQKDGPLELALIGPGPAPTSLTYYHASTSWWGTQVGLEPGTPVSMVGGVSILTGNLAVIEPTATKPGVEALIAGTTRLGSPAVFLDGAATPRVTSMPGTSTSAVRQLVAGGKFLSLDATPQVATFVGSAPNTMTAYYVSAGDLDVGLKKVTAPLANTINPVPLALATGSLSPGAYTDTILVVGQDTGSTQVYSIKGGDQPVFTPVPGIDSVAAVAIGKLDSRSLTSQVVFGQTSGVTIGISGTMAADPTISFSTFLKPTQNPASAVTIVDYNGDGINDIVYASRDGIHALINQGTSPGTTASLTFVDALVFAPKSVSATAWNPTSILATEFSGDIRPEFIVTNGATAQGAVPVLFLESGCPPSL